MIYFSGVKIKLPSTKPLEESVERIFGKVISFHPADGGSTVDLWHVIHSDGDEEDLELHEVQSAMLRYKQIQAKPLAEPVNLPPQPSANRKW